MADAKLNTPEDRDAYFAELLQEAHDEITKKPRVGILPKHEREHVPWWKKVLARKAGLS